VTTLFGAILGAVIGIPAIGYMLTPAYKGQTGAGKVELGPLENFPDGVPTLVTFTRTKINGWEKTVNSYGVYVLRRGDNTKVLSNTCTHLSCRVKWNEQQNSYICPCHDGWFDIEGNVTSGPPPKPLVMLESITENGKLFIDWKGA
jgi:Rieske Fe-S protein